MNETETVDCILKWLGYRAFRIRDISNDRIDELLADDWTERMTWIGKRSLVGKRLSSLNGRQFDVGPNQRVAFAVVQWATQSIPGIYQVVEQ